MIGFEADVAACLDVAAHNGEVAGLYCPLSPVFSPVGGEGAGLFGAEGDVVPGNCRIIAMHVIQRSGKLNSKWTGHALIIAEEGAAMHDTRPDPMLYTVVHLELEFTMPLLYT